MQDYYFKFVNSGIAYSIAYQAGLCASGENGWSLVKFTPDYAIDLIGPVSGASEYYHLNLRIMSDSFIPPSGAEPYKINMPNSPVREWF